MISSASICSVIRIVPISEAMFDPTLPARISATTAGRIPLKTASTTGSCSNETKNIATSNMMTNEGTTTPSTELNAPR